MCMSCMLVFDRLQYPSPDSRWLAYWWFSWTCSAQRLGTSGSIRLSPHFVSHPRSVLQAATRWVSITPDGGGSNPDIQKAAKLSKACINSQYQVQERLVSLLRVGDDSRAAHRPTPPDGFVSAEKEADGCFWFLEITWDKFLLVWCWCMLGTASLSARPFWGWVEMLTMVTWMGRLDQEGEIGIRIRGWRCVLWPLCCDRTWPGVDEVSDCDKSTGRAARPSSSLLTKTKPACLLCNQTHTCLRS